LSKVAIQGDPSGSGTFTIASPNSNNNRTLTLPDATGTVVVSGSAVTFGALTATTLDVGAGSASTPSLTFTGDTNTGIYSPGADRIGFTEGGTQVGEFDASGNFLFNSGYGSAAIAYGCRAWVNFNGTGTVAIRASGNVSTITDNGTGDYTVNMTNALTDANYAAVVSASLAGAAATFVNSYSGAFAAVTPTTTTFRFQCSTHTSAVGKDAEYAIASIFR